MSWFLSRRPAAGPFPGHCSSRRSRFSSDSTVAAKTPSASRPTFGTAAVLAVLAIATLSYGVGQFSVLRADVAGYCEAAADAGASTLAAQSTGSPHDAAASIYLANVSDRTDLSPAEGSDQRHYTIGFDHVIVTTPYADAFLQTQGLSPADVVEVRAARPVAGGIFSVTGRAVAVRR